MSHAGTRKCFTIGSALWTRLTLGVAVALSLALGSVAASDPPDTWLLQARQRIEQAEYDITWQTQTVLEDLAASWQAPNRAQGFRTYFTRDGIRVVPRAEETPSWEWSLRLVGWGRPGAVEAVEAASLRPKASRIDYDRGGFVEWYVNTPRGAGAGIHAGGAAARR